MIGGPRDSVVRGDVPEADRERPVREVARIDADHPAGQVDRLDVSLPDRYRRSVEHPSQRDRPARHVALCRGDLTHFVEFGAQHVNRVAVDQDDRIVPFDLRCTSSATVRPAYPAPRITSGAVEEPGSDASTVLTAPARP